MSGRAYYSLALDTACELADDQLTAVAHGHAAQLAAHEGMITAAQDHLTAAREHAQSTPAVASWLASIEATIHADRGDQVAARQALDRAETVLDQPAGRPAPASFRSCSVTHVTAATGHVFLQAGETDGAREALTAALNQSHPIPRRQRVLVLIDLATAELRSGNFSDACSYATKAADLLHHVAYAVGAVRLHTFRAAAQRPLPSGALRVLDAYLSEIAA